MDQSSGFISVHEIINDVFNTFDTEDVPFGTLVEFVADALLLINSFDHSSDKTVEIEICDWCGMLPCDIIHINQTKTAEGVAMKYTSDSFHIHNKTSSDLYNKSKYVYTINGDNIFTSFEEGTVVMNYRALPIDEKGYPLIPNDIKFKEAVRYHLMWKIAQRLFYKGKINQAIFQNIEQNRDWYIGAAQSRAAMRSHDQMESLSNQFVRLIQDSSAHDDFYATTNLPQKVRIHPTRNYNR